jgi:branched-chain amino acid transport system ATP-binding protein
MLEVAGVTKTFGGLTAVDDVSFSIGSGELVGLIGPNGAGKTTLFNTVTGVLQADSGTVSFQGTDITNDKPSTINQHGIARTFQIVRTFDESTVLGNVTTGAVFGASGRRSTAEGRDVARKYISFVGLDGKEDAEASELTIADRKHVELARALACEPDLLMLDELGSGLTPTEIDDLCETIERVRSELNVSVFWIEHIMEAIMDHTDRILVLNEGELIADGPPSEIQQNEAVSRAYLGGVEV